MSPVYDRQTMLEQLASQSRGPARLATTPSHGRYQCSKVGMGSIHLLQNREHVLVLFRSDGVW